MKHAYKIIYQTHSIFSQWFFLKHFYFTYWFIEICSSLLRKTDLPHALHFNLLLLSATASPSFNVRYSFIYTYAFYVGGEERDILSGLFHESTQCVAARIRRTLSLFPDNPPCVLSLYKYSRRSKFVSCISQFALDRYIVSSVRIIRFNKTRAVDFFTHLTYIWATTRYILTWY